MFLRLEVLVDFAVDLDVLEGTVKGDQDFGVDSPVVQVRDVPFENEFEGAKRTNQIFMFIVQTLKQN